MTRVAPSAHSTHSGNSAHSTHSSRRRRRSSVVLFKLSLSLGSLWWLWAGVMMAHAMATTALVNDFAGGLVLSLWKRTPRFGKRTWLIRLILGGWLAASPTAPRVPHVTVSPRSSGRSRSTRLIKRSMKRAKRLMRLVFGVDSRYFWAIHMLREAIEVAAQVDQAYNASVLVSHSYINHLLVVVLVINSWSTPVIHRVMHVSGVQTTNDVVRARVACLLVDAFLNAVSSMAVPIVLLVPFWRDFIWEIHDFPLQLMYNDVFYARVATESQMIAASNFWALCMKLVPLISVYLCLSTVSNLAELRTVKLSDRRLGIAAVTHQSNPLSSSASAGRIYMNPQRQITTQSGGRFGHYINIIVQFGFAITGIVVVAIHVAAHASALRLAQDAQCDLVVAPWFTTKYPCMVYTYDCDALNDTAAGGDYLSFLDDRALLTLNFAHCSELVVPTDIQRFSNLLGMNFKHVVLAEWPMDAVLTPHLFPSMLFLVFSHVNWSGIPEVLLGPLPEKLGDIEMSHTNISIIPDDLDQYWFNVGTLVIEFCEIKQIPETLMRMNLYDISLVGNKLENVSVLTRLPDSIVHVMLDHNPFRELPASFENADIAIAVLSAGHTLVEEVPVILAANVDQIFLMDTPHCASASGWQPSVPVICDRSYYRSDGMCQLT